MTWIPCDLNRAMSNTSTFVKTLDAKEPKGEGNKLKVLVSHSRVENVGCVGKMRM